MKSILEELWYSSICSDIGCRAPTQEKKDLMRCLSDRHGELWKTLTDEQRELLEGFSDCYADLIDAEQREIFTYAFRLGARIAIEVMSFCLE